MLSVAGRKVFSNSFWRNSVGSRGRAGSAQGVGHGRAASLSACGADGPRRPPAPCADRDTELARSACRRAPAGRGLWGWNTVIKRLGLLADLHRHATRRITGARDLEGTSTGRPCGLRLSAQGRVLDRAARWIGPRLRAKAQKAFGRVGAGPCQGRYCGLTIPEILSPRHTLPHAQIGAYRIRLPLKPITLGALSALEAQDAAE